MTDDLARQRKRHPEAEQSLDVPNCPECLHRMEPQIRQVEVGWECPNCGHEGSG